MTLFKIISGFFNFIVNVSYVCMLYLRNIVYCLYDKNVCFTNCNDTIIVSLYNHIFINMTFSEVEHSQRSINTEVTVAMVEEDIEFTGSNREVLCKYVDGYLNRYYTLITCDQWPLCPDSVQCYDFA